MNKPKFKNGSFVKIKVSAQTDSNKRLVKEDTYGTVNSTFRVISFTPALTIQGETTPASYWITPVHKTYSAVCMHENELRTARCDSGIVKEEEPSTVNTSDLDEIEVPDLSDL